MRQITVTVPDAGAMNTGDVEVNVHFAEKKWAEFSHFLEELRNDDYEVSVRAGHGNAYAIATGVFKLAGGKLEVVAFGPKFSTEEMPSEEVEKLIAQHADRQVEEAHNEPEVDSTF